MEMTIDKAIERLSTSAMIIGPEDWGEARDILISTARKYQKIKEQVDIAIDKENFIISDARLIQIREIIDGKID